MPSKMITKDSSAPFKYIIKKVLEPTKYPNVFSYVDRNGYTRFMFKLVGRDKFYSLGGNHFQEIILSNEGKEVSFRDQIGILSLEEILKSQLEGKGAYVYFWDNENKKVEIGDKSDLKILVNRDPILALVYSELQPKK